MPASIRFTDDELSRLSRLLEFAHESLTEHVKYLSEQQSKRSTVIVDTFRKHAKHACHLREKVEEARIGQ